MLTVVQHEQYRAIIDRIDQARRCIASCFRGRIDRAQRRARDERGVCNGRELYRVRVGPTRDRASAEALAAELKRAGQSGSIVPIS